MDVKDAVIVAKDYISELFADERPMNIGLEEVDFDDTKAEWKITVGFSRFFKNSSFADPSKRAYKVVRIANSDGSVRSVKNRD